MFSTDARQTVFVCNIKSAPIIETGYIPRVEINLLGKIHADKTERSLRRSDTVQKLARLPTRRNQARCLSPCVLAVSLGMPAAAQLQQARTPSLQDRLATPCTFSCSGTSHAAFTLTLDDQWKTGRDSKRSNLANSSS